MKTLDDYLLPLYYDVKRNFTLFWTAELITKTDDPYLKRIWTRVLMCSIATKMIWDGEY